MGKRIIFVLCVFNLNNPSLSIPINVITTTINTIFILHCRPFSDDINNKIEVFNDVVTTLFLVLLEAFIGDYFPDAESRRLVAWGAVGVFLLYLLVHITY